MLVFPAGHCASQGSSFSSPVPLPGLWEGCYQYLGIKTSSCLPAQHGDRAHSVPSMLHIHWVPAGAAPAIPSPRNLSLPGIISQLGKCKNHFPLGFSYRGSLRCRYRRKECVPGRRQEQRTIFPSIFTANLRGGNSDELVGKRKFIYTLQRILNPTSFTSADSETKPHSAPTSSQNPTPPHCLAQSTPRPKLCQFPKKNSSPLPSLCGCLYQGRHLFTWSFQNLFN